MCQNTSNPNLQLNHNFRWLLCANHMEPVRGLISRYLSQKLVQHELEKGAVNITVPSDMACVVQWMPQVWNHLNHFLEVHHSSELALGPATFIQCPVEMEASEKWFTDLWNYSIRPYLIQVAQEGLRQHGLRKPFEDPTEWIFGTNPWKKNEANEQLNITPLRLEDIQPFTGLKIDGSNSDPLSDMLLRLQVAASTAEDHSSHNLIHQNQPN